MKKQISKKIIITIGLIFICTQFIYPLDLHAAAKLNWDNPNQGKNPYKFKLSDYLNTQNVMSVVGCTGIVNKVSKYMTGLLQSKNYKMQLDMMKTDIAEAGCLAMELGLTQGTGTFPNLTVSEGYSTLADYCKAKKAKNPELYSQAVQQYQLDQASKFRMECLNGIAYTLARNQLTTMTKQTMNWVTTGFNGDPMYVRNINNFMNSVEDEIIYQELNAIKNLDGSYNTRDYPYGKDFTGSYIKSRQSAQNFAESSKQDLTNYLTRGATIQDFANDFSKGGWNAWLGLTQRANNNPLGYTMNASQNIADKQAKETENVKEELANNDNFLSQKKCVSYGSTKKSAQKNADQQQAETYLAQAKNASMEGLSKTTNICKEKGDDSAECVESKSDTDVLIQKYNKYLALSKENYGTTESGDADCTEWETVTPGSLIRDKVSYYLNSPERQLEMADDINEVLNVLFAKLIDKLRLDGLSSLNSEDFNNNSGGIGSNSWTTPVKFTDVEGNKYAGSGLDENRAFDLTKDLGNIYNHSDVTELGTWDANTNTTFSIDGKKGLPLIPGRGEANTYYKVTLAGNTKLFADGYNAWAIGDRAFFDGTTWQNWKKDTNSPIAKRGIIQIQKDYIVVAKELLKVMPGVMPALGELDYCIPGPNPNWQANSTNAYEAFSEYVSDLKTIYYQGATNGNKGRDRVDIIDPQDDPQNDVYQKYHKIFAASDISYEDNSWTSWSEVLNTNIISYIRKLSLSQGAGGGGSTWSPLGWIGSNSDSGSDIWVGEEKIAEATDEVSEMIQSIFDSLDIFNEEYPKTLNKIYGPIQNEFLNYEGTAIKPFLQEKNPAWIPMAKDGLTITKKILFYDEEIIDVNADLKESINEADSVINKLELIKGQVGQIIKTAQDRRDKTITEALNEAGENPKFTTNTAYKIKYAECLNEENIDYLDYNQIIVKEENRCGDKLDNDFDGLVDIQDEDCKIRETGVNKNGNENERDVESASGRRTNPYSRESNAY